MSGSRSITSTGSLLHRGANLGDLLTTRPAGLVEAESWAILCQSVQALQDLFLSDGASGKSCIPLVTPQSLILSSKGRVKLCQSHSFFGCGPPAHLAGYLAPEYRANKSYSDTEFEKMWIYGLGETLKRATLTSHAATSRLSKELCQVLADMTKTQASSRASLMHLLDVMSQYCQNRLQNRPFSHIAIDLHQEALAAIEVSMDTPWGPPAMPELVPRTRNRSESTSDTFGTIPRRWHLPKPSDVNIPRFTKEASTSMENLSFAAFPNTPGNLARPKSMCVPDSRYQCEDNNYFDNRVGQNDFDNVMKWRFLENEDFDNNCEVYDENNYIQYEGRSRRYRVRKNPVQRAASRLYRAGIDLPADRTGLTHNCVGPEFVVRASLPNKKIIMDNTKSSKKVVTVIMLDGQKLDVTCNPTNTTAGQLFELIIQKEHIEENFMLGLSALIAGDFVFLPSDTRISKVMQPGSNPGVNLTLFLRVRFFLPSLRGIRGSQARHLLYLQLRRSILEHQLPCSFSQIIELNGLALQAEFGNHDEREHGARDYFLLEHYVPETMTCVIDDQKRLREELIKAHISKKGLEREKAEQDFIIFTQSLPHYGGHFYTATWMLKDNNNKDIWLYISAQGINLYERGKSTSNFGPQLYEMFEWRSIQTLCYSKHYLCILPHSSVRHRSKLKKYKLKMDHKKSYFAFRLASLHHQFFLRLRTEYTSLQSLAQQFGIPLKDIKNETNSLCKLDVLTQPLYSQIDPHEYEGTVNAETEFKIEFRASSGLSRPTEKFQFRRSKSFQNINKTMDEIINENHQNKKNENTRQKINENGLVLDSSYFAGLPVTSTEKRRGVKMGTRAFSNLVSRVSRSMEAINASNNEYLEEMSLQSISLHCSSTSISKSSAGECLPRGGEAYIIDSTIKDSSQQLLPNFQESLNETLIEKLNNMSFAEERCLSTVMLERDQKGSFGLQITEGSDGNVYIQSVILGGPAHLSQNILSGDQVIAVNGQSLLGVKYLQALELLKGTGQKVEFVLSRVITTFIAQQQPISRKNRTNISQDDLKHTSTTLSRFKLQDLNKSNSFRQFTSANELENSAKVDYKTIESPIEKHVTESCHDLSNSTKYNRSHLNNDVSPPCSVRHQYELQKNNNLMLEKNFCRQSQYPTSRSLTKLRNDHNRAVIVDMIPKLGIDWSNFKLDNGNNNYNRYSSLKRNKEHTRDDTNDIEAGVNIALPRSLGLSRKWKGPVRYPVTPVKNTGEKADDAFGGTSDEEQVFI